MGPGLLSRDPRLLCDGETERASGSALDERAFRKDDTSGANLSLRAMYNAVRWMRMSRGFRARQKILGERESPYMICPRHMETFLPGVGFASGTLKLNRWEAIRSN